MSVRKVVGRLVLMGAVLAASAAPAAAQVADSLGSEFWLGFMSNYNGQSLTLTLFLTGPTSTSGTIDIPGLGFSQPFVVTAGAVTSVVLPNAAMAIVNDTVQSLGVHVTADDPITVYGLNRIPYTTDAFLGLPVDVLGNDYVVLTYGSSSEFLVVGAEDATTVTVTPAVAVGVHPAGVPYNVVLNAGQTYLAGPTNDLSGSLVTSDKAIAVFGGASCATVPQGVTYCDHLVEQLPPTDTWGARFVTAPLAARTGGDRFRFLASTDGTSVSVNGSAVAALNRGDYHEMVLTAASEVTANEPVLVAQYAHGGTFDGAIGDPFMMLIPPLEQFLGAYTITTPATGFAQNYSNVVAPTAVVGSVTLDGAPIPAGSFTAIGSTAFSFAQVSLTLGAHRLASPQAFGVFTYGFNTDDSYGYPGGLSLAPVATLTSLVLTPESQGSPVGVEVCLEATARDQRGDPVEGIRVDFSTAGANAASGFAFTNAAGVAEFCYTGNAGGLDLVTATSGSQTDTSEVLWTAIPPTPAPTPTLPPPPPAVPASTPQGLVLFTAVLALGGALLLLRRTT